MRLREQQCRTPSLVPAEQKRDAQAFCANRGKPWMTASRYVADRGRPNDLRDFSLLNFDFTAGVVQPRTEKDESEPNAETSNEKRVPAWKP